MFTFFGKENSKNVPKKMVKFRSWKTWKSRGKGRGKSWNFKSEKDYEPCKCTASC